MTLETLGSIGHGFDTPRFRVTVGSESFEETDGRFTEVMVERTIDGADRFSLAVAAEFDHEAGEFVDVDWETFATGTVVEIEIGYGERLRRVLVGSITEHSTDFPAGDAPSVTIGGYGRYHELTGDVVTTQWSKVTDAEIVTEIAEAYGFEPVVDETWLTYDVVENEKDSDARFLTEKLAARNAGDTGPFEVFARLDELVFRAPGDGSEPELTLTYGESLHSFTPELTDAQVPALVRVRNWDPSTKTEIVGVAEHEGGTNERTLHRAVFTEDQAERIATAMLHRARHDRARGTATTIGLPEIGIGEPIRLTRVGRFSGIYYVETVTHTLGTSGYTTDVTVRAAADGVTL